MANCSHGRGRTARTVPVQAPAAAPRPAEPPVRRWPHPVNGAEPIRETDGTLHYIRCALSYQNQLLADIKALLEQLVAVRMNAKET